MIKLKPVLKGRALTESENSIAAPVVQYRALHMDIRRHRIQRWRVCSLGSVGQSWFPPFRKFQHKLRLPGVWLIRLYPRGGLPASNGSSHNGPSTNAPVAPTQRNQSALQRSSAPELASSDRPDPALRGLLDEPSHQRNRHSRLAASILNASFGGVPARSVFETYSAAILSARGGTQQIERLRPLAFAS